MLYRLRALQARVRAKLEPFTALVTPTVGTLYTVQQVLAEPYDRNTHMGYYTYFANPLRLCAISVPVGRREDGMPFSVSLAAPSFREANIEVLARALTATAIAP